jgi:2'-5' RNA ligase
MRLFIAINLNGVTKNRLLALRDELRSNSERGRFAAPENLHLTLAFLGECDRKQTSAAQTAMNATSFEPFPIAIERLGRFKRDGGDIWWAGVQDSAALLKLQRALTSKLIDAGFSLDRRQYSPHITLGREVATAAMPRPIETFGETVAGIELMKSERLNGKLVYTAIYQRKPAP